MSDFSIPAAGWPASRRPSAATAALTMAGRCLRLTRRNLQSLLMSVMLPIMLLLVFVYLFGGAIHTGTRYVTYIVPGVILLCAGFGSAQTTVSVSQDMAGGIIDRFRSMDISGAAVLAGHVAPPHQLASWVRHLPARLRAAEEPRTNGQPRLPGTDEFRGSAPARPGAALASRVGRARSTARPGTLLWRQPRSALSAAQGFRSSITCDMMMSNVAQMKH